MKLLLNIESLIPPLTGIGNYTYNLIEQLLHEDIESIECFIGGSYSPAQQALRDCLAASERFLGEDRSGTPGPSRLNMRSLLRQWTLAYRARELLRDVQLTLRAYRYRSFVYHEPNFMLKAHAGPKVSTIHDLSFIHYPQFHPRKRVEWLTRQLPKTLRRADFLITDSDVVRDELIADFGVAADRVRTVYLGASEAYRPHSAELTASTLQRHNLQHGQYILFVGTLEPRKGVDLLVDAWCRLPTATRQAFPLVLVGAPGWHNTELNARIKALEATHGLRQLSFVAASELPALYAGAAAFVYPSLYEGFGLPVLEAMQSGVPVICTAGTSMSEFAGNGVLCVENGNSEHLHHQLERLLESPEQRRQLIASGLAKAGEFSWQRCARETHEVYRTVSPD